MATLSGKRKKSSHASSSHHHQPHHNHRRKKQVAHHQHHIISSTINKNTPKSTPSNHHLKAKKGKMKAFIDIPGLEDQSDDDHSDSDQDDHQFGQDDDQEMVDGDVRLDGQALAFLSGLDKKGITRSRLDQVLENRKNRPKQSTRSKSFLALSKISTTEPNTTTPTGSPDEEENENLDELEDDDFALLGSGDSDDDLDLMSDMPSSISGSDLSGLSDLDSDEDNYSTDDSALEQAYYASKRPKHRCSSEADSDAQPTESKLPVRCPDGTIKRFPNPSKPTSRVVNSPAHHLGSYHSPEPVPQPGETRKPTNADSSLGARFGRHALSELLSPTLSLKTRVQSAKVEIAWLAQEALADPEMGLGSLKRLLAMCCPTLKLAHENDGQPLKIDPPVRMMAILSLLAVFLDIIPGYRIRPITEAEKHAKVSQMVARQREWEDGLVNIYRRYLEVCEKEVVSNSTLSACSLKSLCQLLQAKTHFNFSHNIMAVLVRKLGRKEWDEVSQVCFDSIVTVFKNDRKGDDSLQLVRLIGRTIKARNYSVHPELLASLLSLRLKTELSGTRASTEKAYSTKHQGLNPRIGKLPLKDRVKHKTKSAEPVIVSKKAKKAMKERAGIEKEIQEAEESVKVEERERKQTETLKMIFGLYFRIIKLPNRTDLLPAALEGLSRFAHLINIDFFRDLLEVLRQHIKGKIYLERGEDPTRDPEQEESGREGWRDKLICIVTAFELLSGQGEALNLDLSEFVNSFYALLIPLSTLLNIDDQPGRQAGRLTQPKLAATPRAGGVSSYLTSTIGELMIKALELIFFMNRSTVPPIRALGFTKRLLTISLTLTSSSMTIKLIDVIIKLIHRQPITNNLLILSNGDDDHGGSSGRRTHEGGIFRPELDDLNLSQVDSTLAWESFLLRDHHWDPIVRSTVDRLLKTVDEFASS